MIHKRYALLANNTIERLYYDDDGIEQREIEKDGDYYYLYHDVIRVTKDNKFIGVDYCKDKIIEESNNLRYLKKLQMKIEGAKK